MKISEILSAGSIKLNYQADSKDVLLKEMLQIANLTGKITDLEEATKQVLKREGIMSTGVGRGIALPHAKTNAVNDAIGVLTILDQPIDFDSLDDEPVKYVFMLLGMENNVGTHLRILSKVSRLMNSDSLRAKLDKCSNSDEILTILNSTESID